MKQKKIIIPIFTISTILALTGCLVQKQSEQVEQNQLSQQSSITPTSTSTPIPTPTPKNTKVANYKNEYTITKDDFYYKDNQLVYSDELVDFVMSFEVFDNYTKNQVKQYIESDYFSTMVSNGNCSEEGLQGYLFNRLYTLDEVGINYALGITPTSTPDPTSIPTVTSTSKPTPEPTKSKITKDDFGYSSTGKLEYSENLKEFVKNLEGYDQFNDMQIQIIIESREFEFRFNRGLELGDLDKYLEMNLGGEENIENLKMVVPQIDFYADYQEKPTSTPIPTTKPTSKPTPKPTVKPTSKPTPKPTKKPENKGMTASETNLVFTSLEPQTITVTVDPEIYSNESGSVKAELNLEDGIATVCEENNDDNPFRITIVPVFNGKTSVKIVYAYYEKVYAYVTINVTVDVDELDNTIAYELNTEDINISEQEIIIQENKPHTIYVELNDNGCINDVDMPNTNYCDYEYTRNENTLAFTFFPEKNSKNEMVLECGKENKYNITIPVIIDVRPEDKFTTSKTVALEDAYIGSTVIMGSYEQDNNLENGTEDVEWLVLDIKDGKALLISKYAIMREELSDDPALNNDYDYYDYIDYINILANLKPGTYNILDPEYESLFKGIIFTDLEKCAICPVNPNESQYIFNLSKEEIEKYFDDEFLADEFGISDLKRTTTATEYVKAQGISKESYLMSEGLGNVRWMASDGYVWYDGSLDKEPNLEPGFIGTKGDSTLVWGYPTATIGIRPAMWVSLPSSTSSPKPTEKSTETTPEAPKSGRATLETFAITTAEGETITLENVSGDYIDANSTGESFFIPDGLGETFPSAQAFSVNEYCAWAKKYPDATIQDTVDENGFVNGGIFTPLRNERVGDFYDIDWVN